MRFRSVVVGTDVLFLESGMLQMPISRSRESRSNRIRFWTAFLGKPCQAGLLSLTHSS